VGQLVALEKFTRTLELASGPDRCWSVLTDVEELVSWVRILHSATELEPLRSYSAVLEDRVGPFALRADLSIEVNVLEAGSAVDVSASGRDRAINSQIDIEGSLRLEVLASAGTRLRLTGQYQVTGRAAALGAGVVRKKGDAAVDEFLGNAVRVLGSVDSSH
jgi:carbon monoxide dehydrogenase subunit G